MTTIRRQAASCLYGLVPLLSNMLTGKLDTLQAMEANDNDAAFAAGVNKVIQKPFNAKSLKLVMSEFL